MSEQGNSVSGEKKKEDRKLVRLNAEPDKLTFASEIIVCTILDDMFANETVINAPLQRLGGTNTWSEGRKTMGGEELTEGYQTMDLKDLE